MSSTTTSLGAFKAAFRDISELPYCSGTVPLDASTATLFYRRGEKAELVNFADAKEDHLSSLAEACRQATFGVDQKDVLDESYRKAGKMDPTDFAIPFSPFTSGIIDNMCETLLEGRKTEKSIRVELYKLNVYGPGSFFKAHVDTPHSDSMFGSLVVVLPTDHEGGSLIFRHRGKECKFDTADAISSQESPHAAFVAFFSDIEHEVTVVTSGHRVTLTYNLHFVDHPPPSAAVGIIPDNRPLEEMKTTLSAFLADPKFLPDGGFLGFGLSHQYPFKPSSKSLSHLESCLKGSDARIRRVCEALSLDVSLRALYKNQDDDDDDEKYACLLNHFADFDFPEVEGSVVDYLSKENTDCILVYDEELGKPSKRSSADPIVWIKPLSTRGSFEQAYVAYGNEASLDYTYGDVCLVAKIGTPRERSGAIFTK